MDEIFRKSTSIFDVVKIAQDTPRRYGKNGELLIDYLDTEAAGAMVRKSSVGAGAKPTSIDRHEMAQEKPTASHDERSGSSSLS